MKYLVSGAEMKEIDRHTIEDIGIPSMVLMERAAYAVACEAEKVLAKRGGNAVIAVCGFGNNGADGIAAARMLHLKGMSVTILLADAQGRQSGEFTEQLAIARRLGIPVCTAGDFIPGDCDLVIDAVFGIGLSRPVEGAYADLIAFIGGLRKDKGAAVAAGDIPSGVSSDTGQILGCAVTADVTVTFGRQKLGQALYPGRAACGRLVVADIGFAPGPEGAGAYRVFSYEPSDCLRIPHRRPYSHKGTWGRVLIAAGSENMAGAAYLSALAAYRCGAGLVKVMTPMENRAAIQELLPEAILAAYDSRRAAEEPERFADYLRGQAEWADVIVLGPGIGTEEYARTMTETILADAYVPIVMDADAINLAAKWPYLKGYFTENIILTPHLAEMSRLCGRTVDEIRSDPLGTAEEFAAQYGLTCVLKDAATVTARKDGKTFINPSGTAAMAKGGSGDVLTGVIAGLIAIGMEECEAASLGVYIHGLAGELAAKRRGTHSVLAGEIAECLGEVLAGKYPEKTAVEGQNAV